MYYCAHCDPRRSFRTVHLLISHYKKQHNAALKAYKCGMQGCSRRFSCSKAFAKHLKQHFPIDQPICRQPVVAPQHAIESNLTVQMPECENEESDEELTETEFKLATEKSADAIVCKYYSHPSLPRNVVQNVVDDVSDFICNGVAMISLRSKVLKALKSAKCEEPIVDEISKMFDSVQGSFDHLQTEYKRTKYFENYGTFIKPVPFTLGKKLIPKGAKFVWCSAKAVHVPLIPVLKKFLELPDCFESILQYKNQLDSCKDFISNFVQCDLWKAKVRKYGPLDIVLPLFPYFDDFESNNQIGPHSSKIGGIYAAIGCLPPEIASRLENIFISTLFYSEDRELFTAKKILKPFLSELQELEENGIEILLPSKKLQRVYIVMGVLLGDNLGVQQLCGFVGSFGGLCNYPCRFCKIFKDRLKYDLHPDASLLRTKENYAEDVEMQDQSRTGVKEECALNSLNSFHVTENFEGDILHDFDEGICHYVMTFVITSLTTSPARNVPPTFKLSTLNRRLVFFNFGSHSALYNTKLCITEDHLLNKKLRMTGSEMQCFVKHFGVLMGDLVPEDNVVWKLYLSLQRVLDVVLAKNIPRDSVALLQDKLKDLGREYLSHNNHLVFKFHKVIWHYVTIILMSGPVSNLSVRRFESKHRQLKLSLYSNMSRVLAIYSVAIKHQHALSYRFHAAISVLPPVDVGSGQLYRPDFFKLSENCCNELIQMFGNLENLFMSSWVNYKGSLYDRNTVIIFDTDDNFGLPIFGGITQIFSQGKKVAFLCKKFDTVTFNEHLHAFQVVRTKEDIVVNVESLVDFHPLNTVVNSNLSYVVLKYNL